MMKIEDIFQKWTLDVVDEQAGLERWNNKADHFEKLKLPTASSSLAMRLIEENRMVAPGNRVLDVGCGGGQFALALEQMGAKAIGTDFSEKMIESCRRNCAALGMQTEFHICNWHHADLDELGWRGKFDLVLANMTPAVASAETFWKLSEASKKWCLMVKPTRRINSVLDNLFKLVGARKESEKLDETIAFAFNILWLKGYSPKLEYEFQTWEAEQPLEKSVAEYTNRIRSVSSLTEQQEQEIKDYLMKTAVDGIIRETTTTLITAMYWQV